MKVLLCVVACAAAVSNQFDTVVGILKKELEGIKKEIDAENKSFNKNAKWCVEEKETYGFAIEDDEEMVAKHSAINDKASAASTAAAGEMERLNAAISKNDGEHADAKANRARENENFRGAERDLDNTIDTLVKAASVIRHSTGGSLVQVKHALTQLAGTLTTVMNAAYVNIADKQKLTSLMQASTNGYGEPEVAAYESQSGGIMDLLAELKVQAENELQQLRKDEMTQQHNFDMLAQSLNDETSTLKRDLGDQTATQAEQAGIAGKAAGDHADASEQLSKDKAHLEETTKACEKREREHHELMKGLLEQQATQQKTMQQLKATNDNSDTLAGGFLQRGSFNQNDLRQEVSGVLEAAAKQLGATELAQMAVRARDDPFSKVKGLISDMIARLEKQAAEENEQHAWCTNERNTNVAKREEIQNKVDKFTARVEGAAAGINEAKQEAAKMAKEVSNLQAALQEATQNRQEDKANFDKFHQENQEAIDGLSQAISLIKQDVGGGAEVQAIVGMLEEMVTGYDTTQAESETAEASAVKSQKELEQSTAITIAQKTEGGKSRTAEAARLDSMKGDLQNDVDSNQKEVDAVDAYLDTVKAKCTKKPMSHEERAAKRQAEIDSLKNAMEILDNES